MQFWVLVLDGFSPDQLQSSLVRSTNTEFIAQQLAQKLNNLVINRSYVKSYLRCRHIT